jgi:23S rRNA (guanosine2251-2'-O)-methyltransferase
MDIRLLLDNIRSTHNVGSIFRTAETVGISKIYCLSTTPAPIDRFGRKRADIAKVSLGAEELVSWKHIENAVELINTLKKDSFEIISIEQDCRSVDYKKVRVKDKTLIVFGNEVDGVSKEILERSDIMVEIPLCGKKESLNVSVAAGVALFRMLDY